MPLGSPKRKKRRKKEKKKKKLDMLILFLLNALLVSIDKEGRVFFLESLSKQTGKTQVDYE